MKLNFCFSKKSWASTVTFILVFFSSYATFSQSKSCIIRGTVKDVTTEKPLAGVIVRIDNSVIGVASGNDGEYIISQIPAGNYTLIVQYIGYEGRKIPVSIMDGEAIPINISLKSLMVKNAESATTVQAFGMEESINRQLTSPMMMNYVSGDKVNQLPDADVKTSISRLPGVWISPDTDELIIRGLGGKYNQILINGIPLPSTSENDRSTDLLRLFK